MLYSFYVNLEMYDRRNLWVAGGTMAAALINLLLNLWALPRWGWAAAAWTTLGSYGVLLGVHAALTTWKLGRGRWVPHAHVWAGAFVLVVEAALLHAMAVFGARTVP
jgi:O-antigen/teichoic acid export membrane protein